MKYRYYIVETNGKVGNTINQKGQPDKYSTPHYFENKSDAERYMIRHNFKNEYGRSYQIKKEEI